MLAERMEIEQSGAQVTATVGLGQADRDQMQNLIGECLERMRYQGARDFVFDLTGVESMSSPCIGLLVEFLQEVAHVRGRISLIHCSEHIMALFKVTKLDQVFEVSDDTSPSNI